MTVTSKMLVNQCDETVTSCDEGALDKKGADMNDQQIQTLIVTRAIILVISALAGVMSIYLGWRLYRDSLPSSVEGEAGYKDWTVKMSAAGPGVFFALFGMGIIIYLIANPFEISSEQPLNESVSTPATFLTPLSSDGRFIMIADQRRGARSCLIRNNFKARFSTGTILGEKRIADALAFSSRQIEGQLKSLPTTADTREKTKYLDSLEVLGFLASEIER
jgi:hypothetical protein